MLRADPIMICSWSMMGSGSPGGISVPISVDNDLYNREGDIWWNEHEVLSLLGSAVNPARFGYFHRMLQELQIDPTGLAALDIGCGGGILAEEFARLGCRVTGIDPSEPSLQTARAHARQSGLEIDYRHGVGEDLPFLDASFDLVYCCDVLEHVDDLDRVIAETARVLKPGGVYFYDTINRTALSKLVAIKVLQDWPWTHVMPPRLHIWSKFIKPAELKATLARHGLENRGLTGMQPRAYPLRLLVQLWRFKRGRIDLPEFAQRIVFGETRDTSVSYMGYAVKLH
jgi:2-polyprenyl-6-hydroxyphenyl methylase / 3-demethylubiquinone-9 3-methyltransferase